MDWIEIIELRAVNFRVEMLRQELKDSGNEIRQEKGLKAIYIYCNASVSTDTSIHIHWKTKDGPVFKSPMGLRLATALKDFGHVNHTIWLKEQGSINRMLYPEIWR